MSRRSVACATLRTPWQCSSRPAFWHTLPHPERSSPSSERAGAKAATRSNNSQPSCLAYSSFSILCSRFEVFGPERLLSLFFFFYLSCLRPSRYTEREKARKSARVRQRERERKRERESARGSERAEKEEREEREESKYTNERQETFRFASFTLGSFE